MTKLPYFAVVLSYAGSKNLTKTRVCPQQPGFSDCYRFLKRFALEIICLSAHI